MNTLFLVQNAAQKPNIEASSKISPTTNLSKFATMLADTKFPKNDNLENIPSGIRPYANHIKEHARLVDDLVTVIKAGSYDIDRRTRSHMRRGTYALHCQIWAELSSKHDFYDMEHLLTGHEELVSDPPSSVATSTLTSRRLMHGSSLRPNLSLSVPATDSPTRL